MPGLISHRLASVALLLLSAPAAWADDSLASLVPADVGLFVELRRADDLLVPLVEPQVWVTLAELAGHPAALKETEHWQQRVKRTVNMSPAEAIRALFSQQVAFVSEGVRSTQNGVVLCRPAGDRWQLIRRWQARPLPTSGPVSLYRLPNNVGLALRGDLFIFGDQTEQGLFRQIVMQLNDPAGRLADDPNYRRLLARVPPDPDGVLFARLSRPQATSAPVASQPIAAPMLPGLPRLASVSSNLLLALHREGSQLRITAVGDAPGAVPARDSSLLELVGKLPESTLIAWAGHLDHASLAQVATALPERSVFRIAYQMHERYGTVQRLAAALDSATCVAIGSVRPQSRILPAPPVPAVAVLVATRDPQQAATEWADLFHVTLALYRLLSLKLATPIPVGEVESLTLAGQAAEKLDLSSLLGENPEQTPLGELHLSWAMDGRVLIIASHSEWLRQVLEARAGREPALGATLLLGGRSAVPSPQTVLVARSAAVSDLGSDWLQFLAGFSPQVLDENWWRNYQPEGGSVRLGIQVTEDSQRQRLVVRSVSPNMPADGVLRPHDEIVGCNHRRFATSQPLEEIQRGLARRPSPRWIDLLVERDRVVRVKRVALPFVDPIEVLRRIVAVGRLVQRVVYVDDAPDAEGWRGHLTLDLRAEQSTLGELSGPGSPAPPAPTAPAVSSSPAPKPPG